MIHMGALPVPVMKMPVVEGEILGIETLEEIVEMEMVVVDHHMEIGEVVVIYHQIHLIQVIHIILMDLIIQMEIGLEEGLEE